MSNIQSPPAVVVGIDGSRPAIHAALWAIDEAVGRDIPVRLVYVIDPQQPAGLHDGRYAAARAALYDAYRAVEATGKPVKIETDVLWGRPLTRLMRESRSAAMVCVGSIGLNHACGGEGSVAVKLGGSALSPVAVIHRPPGASVAPRVTAVVTGVDNGVVLRQAFEEASLRGVSLRAVAAHVVDTPDDAGDGNRLAQIQLSRRLARWTRLHPEVPVEPTVVQGGVSRYLADNADSGQLFVTDSHAADDVCGAFDAGCSVLTVRCGNL